MKKTLLFIFFILTGIASYSQKGSFYINNYTPATYGASDQNWSVTQDSLGRFFVANLNGIMLYDGVFWKIITIRDDKECTTLSKSIDGTILVGGNNEFGYLQVTEKGIYKYASLSIDLPKQELDFGNIWAIHCIGNDIFFCSNEKIFWFQNKKFIKSFTPTGEKFHTFFKVDNTLIVREQGVGLLFFRNGALHKILGSGELADVRVYSILPLGDNLYWLCSRSGMFTLYFNVNKPEISNLSRTKSPIDDWMIESDIYCGRKLNENLFALGSLKKGIILIDRNFTVLNSINYEKGLQDDAVKFIFQDYSGNIMLALNKGVSYIEISNPITQVGKNSGVNSTIESIAKFDNVLFIATDKGIEKFNPQKDAFEYTELSGQSWDFKVTGNEMLIGTSAGLFGCTSAKTGFYQFPEIPDVIYKIFPIPGDENSLLLASEDYVLFTRKEGKSIKVLKQFDYAAKVKSFAYDDEHKCVFFGSESENVYVFFPASPDTLKTLTLESHQKAGGHSIATNVSNCDNSIIFVTDNGIYKPTGFPNIKLVKDDHYDVSSLKDIIFYYGLSINKDVWLTSASVSDLFNLKEFSVFTVLQKEKNGTFKVRPYHYLYGIRGISRIHCYLIDGPTVYLGSESGLFIYSTPEKESYYKFNTFISRVVINNDTVSFFENFTPITTIETPQIKYKNNKINFLAAASDFYNVKLLEFSYYLEGKEETFGEWTLNRDISYSGLSEGTYTFHLRSRNVLGVEGNPVAFTFTILPPWYRTYWAYTLYLLCSIALIWFIVQYNTRRLKEQNIKLEHIITERTKEIEHQKEEIEHKNQEITDSINYAKRIQQAILPPVQEIVKVWSDLFVFYQPKDIVSGDFYWFNKINDHEILIACADCTGHGVPGGFMSMICSDKLTDAVKITHDPEKILFHTNNNVKKALRQTETSDENVNKDGMEISLVRVNFQTQKIWYAGANRPLWLLKKGSEEIEEIKPTKASIASFTQPDFEYQGHEIQLVKGDIVYMTSDGYPDQFGGQEGKKFMTKNFKKLILSIKELGMREQESTVKNVINQWKEGYEQVDDLLVIAFKL